MPVTKDIGGGHQLVDLGGVAQGAMNIIRLRQAQQEMEEKLKNAGTLSRIRQKELDLAEKKIDWQVQQLEANPDLAAAKAAREKGERFRKVLGELPSLYRTHGPAATNKYLSSQFPGASIRPTKDGGQILTGPGIGSTKVNINRVLKGKELVDTEIKTRKDFAKDTQDQHEGLLAFDTLERLAASDPTGMKDITMIYLLIRGLDPGGRVTDREIELPGTANPLHGQLVRWYQNVSKGEKLTEEQRKQILAVAKKQVGALRGQLAPTVQYYTNISNEYGLNPNNVLQPRGQVWDDSKYLKMPSDLKQYIEGRNVVTGNQGMKNINDSLSGNFNQYNQPQKPQKPQKPSQSQSGLITTTSSDVPVITPPKKFDTSTPETTGKTLDDMMSKRFMGIFRKGK